MLLCICHIQESVPNSLGRRHFPADSGKYISPRWLRIGIEYKVTHSVRYHFNTLCLSADGIVLFIQLFTSMPTCQPQNLVAGYHIVRS